MVKSLDVYVDLFQDKVILLRETNVFISLKLGLS